MIGSQWPPHMVEQVSPYFFQPVNSCSDTTILTGRYISSQQTQYPAVSPTTLLPPPLLDDIGRWLRGGWQVLRQDLVSGFLQYSSVKWPAPMNGAITKIKECHEWKKRALSAVPETQTDGGIIWLGYYYHQMSGLSFCSTKILVHT